MLIHKCQGNARDPCRGEPQTVSVSPAPSTAPQVLPTICHPTPETIMSLFGLHSAIWQAGPTRGDAAREQGLAVPVGS